MRPKTWSRPFWNSCACSNLETERQAAPDYSRRAARAACEAGDAPDASTRTAHCGALYIHELTRTETEQYITHRMSVAGAAHTVTWSRRALRLITTRGDSAAHQPLCDRVLMTAFVRETHRVSAAIVRQSAQELARPWQSKRLCWLRRAT